MEEVVKREDFSDPMKSVVNDLPCSQLPSSVSQGTLPTSSVLKKMSPLKHVTPIIKKYNCQRQAKNGKSAKLKSQGKNMKEESTVQHPTPVPDLIAGMDSLDAALRRAEIHLATGKDQDNQADILLEHSIEPNSDDIVEGEEEGISSVHTATNQHNSSSARSSQLRNRNRVLKKRNQLQKDLQHTLPLAAPDQFLISEEKSLGYSIAFFQKVRTRFETQDNPVFTKFMQLMYEFEQSIENPCDLYHRIIELFDGHPDLCEDFLGFLRPFQAIQCGKFMEHLAFSEMSSFLHKLELYFVKQPQHLKKIHASWARLAETPDLTLETVRSSILPLLRGNTFLVDSFLALLPSEKPPESKMTDFDQVICKDTDNELAEGKETFERVEIPPESDDPYGGENCQCCCHSSPADSAFVNRTKHCIPCGIKFISGKVYLQTEHGLRPGRIDFSGGENHVINVKRLNADHQKLTRSRSRRNQGNTPQGSLKVEDFKQNVETDDEAVFASKMKSPRQRPKITKHSREKPSSARSLSLNRAACSRKGSTSKCGSFLLPVINDQDALPAPSSSEDKKTASLDFSVISDVIQMDQDQNDQHVLSERNSVQCDVLDQTIENVSEALTEDIEMDMKDNGATCDTESKQEIDFIDNVKDNILASDGCKIMNKVRKETICENISTHVDKQISQDEEKCDGWEDKDTAPENCSGSEVQTEVCAEGSSSKASAKSPAAGLDGTDENSSGGDEEATWTKTEDRIILCTFQSESDQGKALEKVSAQLAHRTINEISGRLQFLVNFIQSLQNG